MKRSFNNKREREYECKYCDRTFPVRRLLREHQASHRGNESPYCSICYLKFFSNQLLMKHMVQSHKDELFSIDELTCEICFKKCKTTNGLKNHTLFHKVEKSLECSMCKSSVHWIGSLQQFNMFKNGEKSFVCQTCDQITMSKLLAITSITKKPRYIQPIISKTPASATVTSQTALHSPAITINTNPTVSSKSPAIITANQTIIGPSLCCDICNTTFHTYNQLLGHQLDHKVEKDLLCSICGVINRWSGTLGQCNKFVSSEEEYTCPKCVLEKEMQCSSCKRMVSRWSGILHEYEQQFICSACNATTDITNPLPDATSNILVTQMFKPIQPKQLEIRNVNAPISQTVTPSQPVENICVLCNANFETFHKLHTHKEVHKVQSQIDCSNCKKLIKWFGSLASLEDFVSGKKRILCTDCVNSNVTVENVQSQVQYVHANVACSNCRVNLKWVGSLTQLEKYTSGLEKILCERCENSVKTTNQNLVQEAGRFVQANVECSSCKSTYQWTGTFTQLTQIMAGTFTATLCPVCIKKTLQDYGINSNTKRKHEKRLVCKICKKVFNKINKKLQIGCDKNVKEIDCKCCSKRREFVCEPCSLNLPINVENTKLSCDLCRPMGRLTFDDLTSFLTHIKCHVPIKDFVCATCNQTGYWGNDMESVNDFKCKRCNTDTSLVQFNKLTKENVIFENKIIDHFNTTPLIEKELECCNCKISYPWYGNEKQLKEFTSGIKLYVCIKCYKQDELGVEMSSLELLGN